MPAEIEVQHLSLAFHSKEQNLYALEDISFSLLPAETLALLGESGSGKSLTALALMRLLPSNLVYGSKSRIDFEEEDLLCLPEQLMRSLRGRRLAMIFQEPMTALNPVLSIGEQLAETIAREKLHGQAKTKRLIAMLNEVEMPEPEIRLQQYPHQLSGGQKQRVLIAMALAGQPDILIADEPTTALDVTIQAQILALLKKLQRQKSMSMIFITHDLSVARAMADRICVIYAGQVVEMASSKDFFKQSLHPYAQQLLFSLPHIEKRKHQLQSIPGSVPSLDAMPAGCRFHPRCAHAFEPCKAMKPLLQERPSHRLVRCHLYPEHKSLPRLKQVELPWPEAVPREDILYSIKDLKIVFKTQHMTRNAELNKAVDGLSFNLYRGRTLALVGESGCGKTTTGKALLGLQSITEGELEFEGKSVLGLRGSALRHFRKSVQIIFQDPFSSMNPRMSVAEILAEGMRVQGLSSKEIQQRQQLLLDQVNLPLSSLDKYPHQFSGGQRQRICIARALSTEPKLIICDEPTSALDISVQAQILNLLKSLQQDFGLAYLFISHNLAVVSYLADDILVMQAGKAVEFGSCEDVLLNPQQPYTKKLLASTFV